MKLDTKQRLEFIDIWLFIVYLVVYSRNNQIAMHSANIIDLQTALDGACFGTGSDEINIKVDRGRKCKQSERQAFIIHS